MNFNSTVKGSELEGFYPAGWDFDKIDACIDAPEKITERQSHWNAGFTPVQCNNLGEFETYMGHEIAMQIKLAKDRKEKIAFILPVGPMGMYKWVVYFLKEWNISCEHVYTFNMDEWADSEGKFSFVAKFLCVLGTVNSPRGLKRACSIAYWNAPLLSGARVLPSLSAHSSMLNV